MRNLQRPSNQPSCDLFFLNSLEQNFVILELLIGSHSIIDDSKIGLEGWSQIVEHSNLQGVFDAIFCSVMLALGG